MPVGRALEEACAQRLFELAQSADDGGLAEAQRPARPPQASRLGDSQEHAQVVPLHGAPYQQPRGNRCSGSGAG